MEHIYSFCVLPPVPGGMWGLAQSLGTSYNEAKTNLLKTIANGSEVKDPVNGQCPPNFGGG